MFNPRLGEPKLEEPNGNDHHVSENGEFKKPEIINLVTLPL
jgi:hypothetical protein